MNNDAFSLRFTAPKMNADGDEAEVMLYGEIISGCLKTGNGTRRTRARLTLTAPSRKRCAAARESFCFGLTVRAAFCARRWRCAAR